jgi:hypothetical protein
MSKGCKSFAVTVKHNYSQRNGRENSRKQIYGAGGSHKQCGVHQHKYHRIARRDFTSRYLTVGGARICCIYISVSPTIKTHSHIASKDHTQENLQEQPPLKLRLGAPQSVCEGHQCKWHCKYRVSKLN